MGRYRMFRFFNYSASIFFLCLMGVVPYVALIPLYWKIIVILLISYFWLAFYFRVVYVYTDCIEFFFPLRFIPLYKRRRITFLYKDLAMVILIYGSALGANPKIKFILNKKNRYLWKYKNDSFGIMPDTKYSKIKELMLFFKEHKINIVYKMSENDRYLFDPSVSTGNTAGKR